MSRMHGLFPSRGASLAAVAALACWLAVSGSWSEAGPAPEGAVQKVAVQSAAGPSLAEVAAGLHHGIDVSGHSGAVDWAQVAAEGHSFAFAKATEGMDLKDPSFEEHWTAMKEAGMVRGAYHFYVTEDDAAKQASFFMETVTLEPGDLAPVVDIEVIGHGTEPGLIERLSVFLGLLEDHSGIKPILYTGPVFADSHLGGGFGAYPLWVAEYGVDEPRLPEGWSDWHLWQWKGDAEVTGVEKGADLSRMNHSRVDLAALVLGP